MQPTSVYRKAARRLGPDVDKLILSVLEQGQGFVDLNSIWGIIGFQKSHSSLSVNEACKQALNLSSPTYRAVRAALRLLGKRYEQRIVAAANA